MRIFRRLYGVLVPVLLSAPALPADAPPVVVDVASEQPIVHALRVSGTITSPNNALLSTAIGGLVSAIHADSGDVVAAGDILLELDEELDGLELNRREAELEQARAAQADAVRRLDEAERVASAAAIAETEIKSRRSQVEQQSAALAAAEAAVRQQRAILGRHQVRAPFAGVIGQRFADIGEWLSPGNPVVELVATDDLRFDFRVPQEYFHDIDVETRVELSSDASPHFAGAGRVQAIVPVKDPAARTFLVRVTVDASPEVIVTPGMSARGTFLIDTRRAGVVINRDALLRYPDGREVVWVVDRETELPKVNERQVETGLVFDGLVEITSGLAPGTTVVTRGNEALQEGQAVQIRGAGGK